MTGAMLLDAFTGDHSARWRNRLPNEVIFASRSDRGYTFASIAPEVVVVRLLAPASRDVPVAAVTKDGDIFHARLARYPDEPPIHSGVYLASLTVYANDGFASYRDSTLASVAIDEDLEVIERPQPEPVPEESEL